jgi:DNA end-binding protein Ku
MSRLKVSLRRRKRKKIEMLFAHLGRVVLTNREHIIALEPMDKGLVGTLLRYPYEVRSADEYFDEIQDVKVTKDMLDLARHIVNQKSGRFEPDKFEDHYGTALVDLINNKRSGKPPTSSPRSLATALSEAETSPIGPGRVTSALV